MPCDPADFAPCPEDNDSAPSTPRPSQRRRLTVCEGASPVFFVPHANAPFTPPRPLVRTNAFISARRRLLGGASRMLFSHSPAPFVLDLTCEEESLSSTEELLSEEEEEENDPNVHELDRKVDYLEETDSEELEDEEELYSQEAVEWAVNQYVSRVG